MKSKFCFLDNQLYRDFLYVYFDFVFYLRFCELNGVFRVYLVFDYMVVNLKKLMFIVNIYVQCSLYLYLFVGCVFGRWCFLFFEYLGLNENFLYLIELFFFNYM